MKGKIVLVTNKLLQIIFDRRGYDDNFLSKMNDSIHGKPLYIDEMADTLHEVKSERITILTDFDTDGIMAGIIAFAGLSELGFTVSLYTPDVKDGYIWDSKVIDKIMLQFPDTKVILTCDTGISCHDGIKYAKDKGLCVLVTDHHKQTGSKPLADVIVNPWQKNDPYDFEICGSYVMYTVLEAYAEKYCSLFLQFQIQRLCVFAGIATVTDLMPVLYENRQPVSDAVTICNMSKLGLTDNWVGSKPYTNAFAGLLTMMNCLEAKKKLYNIDESLFGWQLGPLLNSPKRMGNDVSAAFLLFLSDNDDVRRAAFEELYNLNEQRKELIGNVMEDLETSYQPYAPFIYFTNAEAGLLGLVASKFSNETGYPCIVVNRLAGNVCKGSGRSPAWFPFLQFTAGLNLSEFSASGHEAAFGISFLGTDTPIIYDALLKYIAEFLEENADIISDDDVLLVGNNSDMDAKLDYFELKDFYHACKAFKPFGIGFPEPKAMLMLDTKKDALKWERLGSEKQHWKGRSNGGFDILLWNQGNIELDKIEKPVIEGTFGESVYNGFWSLNFVGELKHKEKQLS